MQKASVIREGAGSTYNVDSNTFEDIDLTQFSDAELAALGIDPSEVEREEEESEVLDDDDDDSLEDEGEEDEEEDEGDSEDDSSEDSDAGEDDSEDSDDSNDDQREENRIPHSRVSQMVEKERERYEQQVEINRQLQEQINQLIQNSLVSQTKAEEIVDNVVDIDALEEKYIEHILNAETKEARDVRNQINAAQRDLTKKLLKEQKEVAKQEYKTELENQNKEEVIRQALINYPILDSKKADYDEELVSDVNALAIGFQNKGMSADKALSKAITRLVKPLFPDTLSKEPKPSSEKPKTMERKKEKANKIAKSPPKTPSSNIKDKTADDIDWENMSEKEFDALYKKNPRMISDYLNKSHI